jgi:hypothetical protein
MPGLSLMMPKYQASVAKQVELLEKYTVAVNEYKGMNPTTKTAAKKLEQSEKYLQQYSDQQRETEYLDSVKNYAEISEGCKTHLIDVYVAKEFGRSTKDIKSKYLEKGVVMEDTGVLTYGIVKGWLPEKNKLRLDDGFIMGEWDFDKKDIVFDIKCSWDLWTFYRNIKFIESPRSCVYYPNMQGYMKLLNKPKSKVVYTLVDTPKELIEREKRYLKNGFVGSEELLEEALKELEKNMTFSDIPMERRIIEIPIERDDEYIENIQKCVIACREYLNNFKEIYYEMD